MIDGAVFSHIEPEVLEETLRSGLPLSIGRTEYRVDHSLAAEFLRAARESVRFPGTSATIQTGAQIVCLYGTDGPGLAGLFQSLVPPNVEWSPDTLVDGTRELGRKVGHAAKDLVRLRESRFDLERLEMLERSGEPEAYEAVCKSAVWPAPDLDSLRDDGIQPEIALIWVACWRMIHHRPACNPLARRAFVIELTRLRVAMESARSIEKLADTLAKTLSGYQGDVRTLVGNRLPAFVRRFAFAAQRTERGSFGESLLLPLWQMESTRSQKVKWEIAAETLAGEQRSRSESGRDKKNLMPKRERILLADLKRSGAGMCEAPAFDRISETFGLTGLEFGNYVSRRQGERLANLLAEALGDLKSILGDWIVPVCRRGNLSIALGARGRGRSCAHYEPGLRVINLTKQSGDGSLTHEFAHFFDQMLATETSVGDARYLSARVHHSNPSDSPIAQAMHRLFELFDSFPHHERLVGDIEGKETYGKIWLTRRGYSPDLDPQTAFDVVADAQPTWFRRGRYAKYASGCLADSLAKYAQASVEVEAAYKCESDYLVEARRLGRYWKCPQELFARAFESYVEDELNRRDWVSQYLVNGTQACYSNCRGLPYPLGAEREQFGELMRGLIELCRDRFSPDRCSAA